MAKVISGYVREAINGQPVPNVNVTVIDDIDHVTIPVGGMLMGSSNPISSDEYGYFEWSSELSPGPVRVEADINTGSILKVRSGKELMQAGDVFISDVPAMGRLFTDGIYPDTGNHLTVSAITGQLYVNIASGAANMRGHLLETRTTRVLAVSVNPNLETRWDRVVLEHHVGGPYVGRQNIAIIRGTSNAIAPPINTNPNVFQFEIARLHIPRNATSPTVAWNTTVGAVPRAIVIKDGSILVRHLSVELQNYIADAFPGVTVQSSGTSRGQFKTLNFQDGLAATDAGGRSNVHIPNKGVAAAKIADKSLTHNQMANLGITADVIRDGAITPPKLGANSVTTAKILNDNVTEQKLAPAVRNKLNASASGGTMMLFQDKNFDATGNVGGWRSLQTASVPLTPGTWVIESQVNLTVRGSSPGSGTVTLQLSGNGTPQGSDQSQRIFQTVQGVPRTLLLTGRRTLTVTSNTTVSATGRIVHQSGANTDVRDGVVVIKAWRR